MPESPHAHTDVRMRGFAHRASVEAACQWVDAHSAVLVAEEIPLSEAGGRVLSADIIAPFDVPPFDRSAMDGYALRSAETADASEEKPLSFRVVGQSLPGRPFSQTVPPASAVRIMTGAPVPAGVDAVVPAELTRHCDGTVEIRIAVVRLKHVGRKGEDIQAGSKVLAAGRKLRPQDLGLMASLGIDRARVVRTPRVRLLITGNELVSPGKPRGEFQIYEANSYMLTALVERDGGRLESIRRVPDERNAIRDAILADGADAILISGGSSVGSEDHAPLVVAEIGTLAIHGIAMRPSSPAGMGLVATKPVFLLPGNPVSCLCAYDFFAGRAIRRLAGRGGDWPYPVRTVVLDRQIDSPIGRVDYCRLQIDGNRADPLSVSGASILSSTTRAAGFVIIPAECAGYPAGATIDAYLYDR